MQGKNDNSLNIDHFILIDKQKQIQGNTNDKQCKAIIEKEHYKMTFLLKMLHSQTLAFD